MSLLCRGDSLTVQKGCVCANSWMDKVVTVMSAGCQPELGTVLRHQRDGSRISVSCPQCIVDYNAFMGGVDWGDQVRGYYSCRTKCRKFLNTFFTFYWTLQSQTHTFCTRATVGVYRSRWWKTSVSTWQMISSAIIAAGVELVVMLVLCTHCHSVTSRQPSQKMTPGKKPSTREHGAADATRTTKQCSLHGTAQSVSCGFATQESNTPTALCWHMLKVNQMH